MRMVLNNGIFYEFVPFNKSNFTDNGDIKDNPETYMIDQVEVGKDYAVLISTCAGAWRYLIGDVIKFVSIDECEILITGRTKHFLSLCGEHLSVDNMNNAISIASEEFNIDIKEFTVAGIAHESLFAHYWFVGTDDQVSTRDLSKRIDEILMKINDDYRVERSAALKEVFVEVLPANYFYKWMKKQGKEGGQNKFPRVIKSAQFDQWMNFLSEMRENATNPEGYLLSK